MMDGYGVRLYGPAHERVGETGSTCFHAACVPGFCCGALLHRKVVPPMAFFQWQNYGCHTCRRNGPGGLAGTVGVVMNLDGHWLSARITQVDCDVSGQPYPGGFVLRMQMQVARGSIPAKGTVKTIWPVHIDGVLSVGEERERERLTQCVACTDRVGLGARSAGIAEIDIERSPAGFCSVNLVSGRHAQFECAAVRIDGSIRI